MNIELLTAMTNMFQSLQDVAVNFFLLWLSLPKITDVAAPFSKSSKFCVSFIFAIAWFYEKI